MRRSNWLTPTAVSIRPNCCQTSQSQYVANRAQLKLFTSTENAKRIKKRIFLGGGGLPLRILKNKQNLRGLLLTFYLDDHLNCHFRMPTIFIFHNSHQEHERLFEFPQLFQLPILKVKTPVCKNQTKSKFCGKGGKFDFFHILMLDRLGYN